MGNIILTDALGIEIPQVEVTPKIQKRVIDLVDEHDPILKQKMEPWDFANPPTDPIQLAYDLTETMKQKGGIGLAANQIGYPYRVFVMNTFPEVYVCFNPKIVDTSEETIVLEEGCLSYPNLFVKIRRPRNLRARFTLPNGETKTFTFADMTARVYQHELDHLDGIIFYTRAFIADRRSAMQKRKQVERRAYKK